MSSGLYVGDTPIGKLNVGIFTDSESGGVGTININSNGIYNVSDYAKANVDVSFSDSMDTVDQPVPDIFVSPSGLITSNISLKEGYTKAGSKSSRYQLTTMGTQTITSNQTINTKDKYMTGDIVVKVAGGGSGVTKYTILINNNSSYGMYVVVDGSKSLLGRGSSNLFSVPFQSPILIYDETYGYTMESYTLSSNLVGYHGCVYLKNIPSGMETIDITY